MLNKNIDEKFELDMLKQENQFLKKESKQWVSSIKNILKSITDMALYLEILKVLCSKCVIIVSVRDTPGNYIPISIVNKMHELGFTKFSKDLWKMYVGVSKGGRIICDLAGNESEKTVNFNDSISNEMVISVESKAWRNGDASSILIDGIEFSTNLRGVNFVVYDIEANELIDAVGFDYHEKDRKLCRRNGCNYLEKVKYKETKKNVVKRKLLSGPIVLWGAEKVAVDFYEKYKNKLDIQKIVTGIDAEKGKKIINCTVEKYSKQQLPDNAFIVICREDRGKYDGTKTVLNNDGFSILENYVRYDIADAILCDKEIMVFVGYCQLLGVMQILNNCPSFIKKYCLRHFHIGWHTKKDCYNYDEFCSLIKLADILCNIPLFQNINEIDIDINSELSDECRRISFPRIPFRGFSPYKSNDLRKYNEDATLYGRIRYPFLYEESILNKLIKENKSKEEIYEIVSNVDLYSKEEVEKNYKLGMKMIKIASEQSDIKIYEYICENIKKQRLFRDGLHFENVLFFEFARKLAEYLQMECNNEIASYEEVCREKQINLQVATEVPILPSVARHLGVENLALADQKYQIKITDEGMVKYLNFKEWIYAYVDYTKAIMKINEIIH